MCAHDSGSLTVTGTPGTGAVRWPSYADGTSVSIGDEVAFAGSSETVGTVLSVVLRIDDVGVEKPMVVISVDDREVELRPSRLVEVGAGSQEGM